jgi:hypothetical protein
MKALKLLLAAAASLAFAGQAYAGVMAPGDPGSNNPPPAGNVIYSLTGQTISTSYQTATVSFVASGASTNLSFAFREDPAFINLSNVSLVDTTTSSGNLVTNGDFSGGTFTVPGARGPQPTGWTYLNTFGSTFGGEVLGGCGPTGGSCYDDGSVQAYDSITQAIATNVGDTYTLTFSYEDTCAGACGTAGGVTTYQPLSTNGDTTDTGGNGRDMFVYAGAIPTRVPEPNSLALLGAGLAGLGLVRWRRNKAA